MKLLREVEAANRLAQAEMRAEARGSRRAAWAAAVATAIGTLIALGALAVSVFALHRS